MAKPFTESIDYVYQWLDDTNRTSENLGDPVDVYTLDGDYTTHNAAFPSYLINQGTYTHNLTESNAVVLSLNDLNERKVQRSGDIITGNFRINQNLIVDTDLIVNGGDVITTTAALNLFNTGATTVNFAGAATSLNIGAATGLTTINHSLTIAGGAGQSFLINDGATTKFSVDTISGNTAISGTLAVTGNTTLTGDLAINGGDLTTTAATFNLINTTATTVNAFGSAVALSLGNGAGTTTVNNNLNVNGGTLATTAATFNLVNATATTVNFAGAATALSIAAGTGTTTVNNNLNVNGGTLATTAASLSVFNTNATTVNFAGAATSISIGAAAGTTTVNNSLTVAGGAGQSFLINDGATTKFSVDSTNGNTLVSGTLGVLGVANLGSTLNVTGNTTLTGDLSVNTGVITSSSSVFSIGNTSSFAVAFVSATNITMGAGSGVFTINSGTVSIAGDLAVNGGDITSSALSFNLLNSGSIATINAFTSATSISIGAALGTTTINNSLTIAGGSAQSFIINDGATTKFSVDSTNGNTLVSGTLDVSNTLAVTGNTTLTGDLAINGGDLTTTAATFNLVNATATTVNFAGAATSYNIGHVATAGQTVSMFTSSTGTSTYSFGTGATASGNIKTLNFGTNGGTGSSTNINLGSTSGGTILFNAPNLRINTTNNGIIYSSGGNGTVGVLTTSTASQLLLSGSSAAPVWSTTTFPSTTLANSFLFSKSANVMEVTEFISSDSTVDFDYTIAGKVNLKTTGQMPSSILVIGDLRVGSNKTGTYSQTGTTTITVNIVGHGMTTGNWVYLNFTSGSGVDGVYQVTVTGADTFTVQGTIQTTSGNVTAEIGGTGNITKVLTVGEDVYDPNTSLYIKAYDLNQITGLVRVEDSVGNTKFSVGVDGKTTINGDLHVQGNIVNTGSSGAVVTQGIVENPVTTTSTTEVVLLSISAATYRSVEFQIQAVEGTNYWTSKILAIHDGTNVNHTEYGMAGIGSSPVSSYAVDISAGNIVLKVTSASANSTVYKVVATAILV